MLYYLALLLITPLLPIMYIQGKLIRKRIPDLPEAKGSEGVVPVNSNSDISPLRVLFLGESTMAGVGVEYHKDGFAGTFAKELSSALSRTVSWSANAKSGYTAKNVTYKILPMIQDLECDLIVIGLGGNDTFTLNHPDRWSAQITKLVGKLKESHGYTPIVFLNMPPVYDFPAFTPLLKRTMGALVKLLGQKLETVASKYNHVFFNSYNIILKEWGEKYRVEDYETKFFSDGIHPSQLTYQIWAKEMVHYVIKNGIL